MNTAHYCYYSFTLSGIFMLLLLALIAVSLDTFINTYLLKNINRKNIILTSGIVTISWLLLIFTHNAMIEKSGLFGNLIFIFSVGEKVAEYLTYIFPSIIFILSRMFVFNKLLKMHYVKSIVSSVVVLILLGYFITQTFDIINQQYNQDCYYF